MKVVVETRSGRRNGHRIWLSARQQVRVGRTEWAEFCVPDDRSMADVQFVLECGGRGCRIRNLSGDRPLWVNGMRVEQHSLVHGDLIRAGSTEFLVTIQLASEEVPGMLPLASRSFDSHPRVAYRAVGDGPEDLVCFTGRREECAADVLAARLQAEHALYVLLHRERVDDALWQAAKAGEAPQPDETGVDPVGLSLPGPELEIAIVGPRAPLDRLELIRSHWDRGAATLLFSGREEPGVRQLLRERTFLSLHPPELAARLLQWRSRMSPTDFDGIAALLLPMSETHWGVFASPRFRPLWERLGLGDPPEQDPSAQVSRFDTFWISDKSAASHPLAGSDSGRTLAAR
ncbi:MAG: hypothetical protein KF774_21110 [Planctomyces sp.]|nr:hypothetical protein [Planctomyces sp.]